MPGTRLDEEAIREALAGLPRWSRADNAITATFEFANFSEAFGFMARVALAAEKLDHHPDWSNSWNRVEISLTSHDLGGVSDLCIALAGRIDKAAGSLGS